MAERLTDKHTVSVYNNSNSEIYLGENEEATKYIYKLAQLEDIMEKYGIGGVEELEELLDDNKYAQNVVVKLLVELQNAKIDRDTWKRACELACDDLGLYEDITITQLKMKCYYQQVKKEKDENKN